MIGKSWMGRMSGMTSPLMKEPEEDLICDLLQENVH